MSNSEKRIALPSEGKKKIEHQKPQKIILTEEEYVSKIDQIIERDFFPDMERLRLRTEFQDAMDDNNLERLRKVQERWGKLVAEEGEEPQKPLISEGLDEFLSTYTSEDNVSFDQIVAETRAKLRQKYWWLFQGQKDAEDAAALPSEDAVFQAIKNKDSSLMLMNAWKYTPKNALMYTPDAAPLTADELAELHKGKPIIAHQNTRLNSDHSKRIELLSKALATAKSRDTQSSLISVDGTQSVQSDYSFVSTPTPAPGVNESPLMTWGEIGSTPLVLDTPGPGFKIPETPAREELLFKLDSDNIKKRKDSMKANMSVKRKKGDKTPLTAAERLKLLSPAAKLLACKSGLATPSPLRISNTPRYTPLTSPMNSKSTRTPTVKNHDQTPSTPSLTDNLLKFVNK